MAYTTTALSIGTGIASIYTMDPILAVIALQGILTNVNTLLDIDQLIDELERKLDKTNKNLKNYQQFIDQKKLEKEILERNKTEYTKKRQERDKAITALMAGDDEIKKAILDFKEQLQKNSAELDLKKGELKSKEENLTKLKEKNEKLESERNSKKIELENIQAKIVENNKSSSESLEKTLTALKESNKLKTKDEKKKKLEETKSKRKSIETKSKNENDEDMQIPAIKKKEEILKKS